ncbi:hypothetical protein [Microvirga sp. P5_D2]
MTEAPGPCRLRRLHPPTPPRPNRRPATVASLGLQVRLAPADVARERQLTDLLAAWDALHAEQEGLFRQILAVLRGESGHGQPEHDPTYSPDV